MITVIANMLRKRALVVKMGLSYALLACLLISVFSFVLARKVTDDLTTELSGNAEMMIRQSRETAELLLTDAYSTFYQVFNKDAFITEAMYGRGLDRVTMGAVSRKLDNLLDSNPLIHSIYIFNFQDQIVFSSLGTSRSMAEFYDADMTELVKGQTRQGILIPRKTLFRVYNQTYEKNFISIVFSDSDSRNYTHGALVVNMDQAALQKLMSDGQDDGSNALILIDETGTVVSHPDGGAVNTNLGEGAFVRKILDEEKKQGRFIEMVEGKRSLVTYQKLERFGWTFIGITDYEGLLGKSNLLQRFIFAIAIIFVLISATAGILFAARFYQPLGRLIRKVRAHEGGFPGGEGMLGEYELLSQSFDSLAGRLSRLQTELDRHMPDAKKTALLSVCTGEWRRRTKESSSSWSRLGFRLQEGALRACIIRMDNYRTLLSRYGMKDLSLLKYGIVNIVEEIVRERACGEVAEHSEDGLTVVIDESAADAFAIMTSIQHHIGVFLRLSVTVGIGTAAIRFEDLERSWNTASQGANYRLVYGKGMLLQYEEIHQIHNVAYEYPWPSERLIIDCLRAGDMKRLVIAFGEFEQEIRNMRYDEIELSLNQLMVISLRAAIEMVDDSTEEWMMELQDAHTRMRWHDTMEEIGQWYISLCERIIDIRDRKAAGRGAEQIDRVLELIEENYGNPNLSVAMLAEAVGWSTNHARKVFKDRTGRSVTQYIQDIRFRKAQQLLTETDLPANKIGEMVGIANSSYFYVSFKKFTGKTPDHYRKAHVLSEQSLPS